MDKNSQNRPEEGSACRPAVRIDYERYERFLEDGDLSDEQKRRFLDALWSMIVGFVDLGFGVHPAQEFCGEFGDPPSQESAARLDMLGCQDTKLADRFEGAGAPEMSLAMAGQEHD